MEIADRIFTIQNEEEFNEIALQIFRQQVQRVPVYKLYVQLLNILPESVKHYRDIPFLPIQFFKTQEIITEDSSPEVIFTSSGTTGMVTVSTWLLIRHSMNEVSVKLLNSFMDRLLTLLC